ncbi:uncharacterized protein LOC142329472 [Lycorma delicatula]|uniref:uncharacterized protein LOC142329472 n=1 Tax=Lycorma delicatula TaxID=130591 RepID=UPI003F513BE9
MSDYITAMSAQRRAGGPIRQLSLQQPQSTTRRPPLRKQSSEDIWDSGSSGLRILANAIHSPTTQSSRTTGQTTGRPRPVKIAWTEQRKTASPVEQEPNVGGGQVEVVARRCKGLPRPSTAKPTQETLDYNRHRLAERLRLAWQQRHPTRTNLDIFLAHNTAVDRPTCYQDQSEKEKEVTLELEKTRAVEEPEKKKEIGESPEKKLQETSSGGESSDDTEVSDQECAESEEYKRATREKEILMRKTSASTTNNRNNKQLEGQSPPPPRRLMSAPITRPRTATPQQLERPPPQRRRIKSVRRRPHRTDEEISSGEDIEHKPRRSRSSRNSEVVTMVSLLSPGHSEDENEDADPPLQPLLTSEQSLTWDEKPVPTPTHLPSAQSSLTTNNITTTPTIVCIRKPVKTVSFQHGGLHSSRSYANNFPSRRGAAAPPSEPPVVLPTAPVPALKRKLFRIKSNTVTGAGPIVNEVETAITLQNCTSKEPDNIIEDIIDVEQTSSPPDSPKVSTPLGNTDEIITSDEVNDVKPEFKSPKEQECWDLFRRMVDKGITVSFETVLRGMLTPTEYRLRKHDLLAS